MGKITNGWHFKASDGFSGSCGGTPVKGYMRGGHVKHDGAGKPQRTAAPLHHPGKHAPKATVHHGHTTPHRYAKGGAIRPHEVEHKDYVEYHKPHDEPVYPEVGTRGKPAGYKGGGHVAHHHSHKSHGGKHHQMHMHVHHHKKGGEVQRNEGHYPREDLSAPHLREPYEAARRGGRILKKAHGGHIDGPQKAARAHLKAHRHETEHHAHHIRPEYQKSHDHGGKAKARGGHSTPHPYAMGGLARPAPPHRMMGKRPPMVSPLAASAPMARPMMGMGAPQMPQGLKHGGRSKR